MTKYNFQTSPNKQHNAKHCGNPKLAVAMPVHQNGVPCLLLLKPLRKMVLELIFSRQSGIMLWSPYHKYWSHRHMVGHRRIYYSQPNHGPARTSLVPLDLRKLIKCSSQSHASCKRQRYSCSGANMPCTSFCVCPSEHECQNERNEDVENAENDD